MTKLFEETVMSSVLPFPEWENEVKENLLNHPYKVPLTSSFINSGHPLYKRFWQNNLTPEYAAFCIFWID